MRNKYTNKAFLRAILVDYMMTFDGGEGSGNHGHGGRPGKVGGSAPAGGSGGESASKAYHGKKIKMSTVRASFKASGTKETKEAYQARMRKTFYEPEKKLSPHKVRDGVDISADFTRNEKDFPNEINDVIHQQGFDGRPKVVSREEFDQFIKDNPDQPMLFRAYSAPDQDTLDKYDRQLEGEEGDWYIDCETGGAQYGQGMYTAGVYGHKDRDFWDWNTEVGDEMAHYQRLNEHKQSGDTKRATEGFNEKTPYFIVGPMGQDTYAIPRGDASFTPYSKESIEPNTFYLTRKEDTLYKGSPFEKSGHDYGWVYFDENKKPVEIFGNGRIHELPDNYPEGREIALPQKADNDFPVSTCRRMTLDPSAKIITTKDLYEKIAEAERKHPDKPLPLDPGVCAAMLGYDAINAGDHGETRNYTVVLNRTKVILDKEPWEVI